MNSPKRTVGILTILLTAAVIYAGIISFRLLDTNTSLQIMRETMDDSIRIETAKITAERNRAQANEEAARVSLAEAQAELARVRDDFDKQLTLIDEITETHERAEAAMRATISDITAQYLSAQFALNTYKLKEQAAKKPFESRTYPITIGTAAGFHAIEIKGTIYMTEETGTAEGVIRQLSAEDGAPLAPGSVSISYLYEQLMIAIEYPPDRYPQARVVQIPGCESRWFTYDFMYDDGGEGRGEVCLVAAASGYYLIEIEGLRTAAPRLRESMSLLLDGIHFGEIQETTGEE